MRPFDSRIYQGKVMHRRHKPKSHKLTYGVFSLLINLDELPLLDQQLFWFSHNRFNLFSFHDRDFGEGKGRILSNYVRDQLSASSLEHVDGSIKVLAYPRILGYAFNPLTAYYCYLKSGSLGAVLYEVNNTFGQRHTYVIPINGTEERVAFHECPKQFYVSPFISMEVSYRFRIEAPREKLRLVIDQYDLEGRLLEASFVGCRKNLCDLELLKLFLTQPLMTWKVIAGIHWEALRLWFKKIPLVTRPDSPPQTLTVINKSKPLARS